MPMAMLDTSVAIHVRDLDPEIISRLGDLEAAPVISVVTLVELEGGVGRNPKLAGKRRALLDAMLETIEVLDFGSDQAKSYGRIVDTIGYVRGRLLDRMIGAHALSLRLPLVTLNARDFRDIPSLVLEDWG